uniref:Glucose-methanol-choline oxidoreductase N-terminal domain-containing protein n=1 Tax=Romanomermis culicivorax TaxID=13658 RepID=A0A915JIE3_ROMCU
MLSAARHLYTGCVLAARLSEDPSKNVLLLEAGPEETALSYVPRLAALFTDSTYDWKFETEKQKSCCQGASEGRIKFPRGRVLGGTGAINFMIYTRGHPEDFDDWARMGNEGWSYQDVLPYFKKSESIAVEKLADSGIHGLNGSMFVSEAEPTPLAELTLEAAKAAGYKILREMTGTENGGLGLPLFASHDGVRQSGANAFLRPSMSRQNLHVVTDAHVTKILIRNSTSSHPKAEGVEFLWTNGLKYTVKSENEVVLSAGAISSPQILMLSGVGPKDHLREAGVPLVLDMPAVGQNMEDHTRTCVVYTLSSSVDGKPAKNYWEKSGILFHNAYKYFTSKKGLFAQPATESMGFFRTGVLNESTKQDIQINIFGSEDMYPMLAMLDKFQVHSHENGYKPNELLEVAKHYLYKQQSMLTGTIIQLHPKSKGFIKLRSSDPLQPPIIDPQFGSSEEDIEVQAMGLRIFMNIIESEPFKQFGPKLLLSSTAGCVKSDAVIGELSDEQLRCIARRRLTTNFHHMSTCRMGNDSRTSVVDSTLRVHGVLGLRVVDASVFPGQISGNTNAPAMMVAERAADMIKKQYN